MFENLMREYGWRLQCTVNVKDTADSTYFCVVGWGPGGYAGIKEVDINTRLAIFSTFTVYPILTLKYLGWGVESRLCSFNRLPF